MKAQAGMEYMLMFAFSLVIAGLIWIYANSNVQGTDIELQIAQTKNIVNKITETVDIAYIEGYPSQFYIYTNFPKNVKSTSIYANNISIVLEIGNFITNITAETIGNMTGSLLTHPGTHKILIKAINGRVEIIDGG